MPSASRPRPTAALRAIRSDLAALADPERARRSAGYFKTGPGEYGEGDVFLGIPVPAQREVAKRHAGLPLDDLAALLADDLHEHRLVALLILVRRFARARGAERDALARFYLKHRRRIDNWDLVDSSAPYVLGEWLVDRPRAVLDRLARSRSLWDRRIAVLATQAFIRRGEFGDTLRLAERLRDDPEDLMHKAVGWMLREVGNRDTAALERFLARHAAKMPRTMLRYAIEKLGAAERRRWMEAGRPARRAAAVLALMLFLAAPVPTRAAEPPPARGARAPAIQLIETHPVETTLGNPDIPETVPAWISLIRGAKRTLDIEQFYLSTWPNEPMDEVLGELGRAAERGVAIRLILDARMYRTYPRTADSLARARNWSVRLIDFARIAGGVQHSKYFLVDGATTVLGSQNFDWRALKHIHEMGIAVRDARVTREFQQVFETDWAVSTPVGHAPDTTRRVFRPVPRRPVVPLPYAIAMAPGDTAFVWPSYSPNKFIPDTTLADLRRIVGLIDGARSEVVLQLLQYSPDSRGEREPAIDDALRRASARGVKVKMLISDWVTGSRGLAALQSLARDAGVEVRLSTLPEWSGGYIPFARVEHAKYMVVDTLTVWVGTANWEPGYFTSSRNLAVTTLHRGLARQAREAFEISWTAPSAAPLDLERKYEPKVRGEDPPPGKTKYGG